MTKEEAIIRYNELADIYKEMMKDDGYEWHEMKTVYEEMERLFDVIEGVEKWNLIEREELFIMVVEKDLQNLCISTKNIKTFKINIDNI